MKRTFILKADLDNEQTEALEFVIKQQFGSLLYSVEVINDQNE